MRPLTLFLALSLLCGVSSPCAASTAKDQSLNEFYQVKWGGEKVMVLPPVTLPDLSSLLSEREAKITPEEYTFAQKLKPLLGKNQYEQALTELENYPRQKSPALVLLSAQLAMQLKRYPLAERYFKQAIESIPDLVRGHLGLASVYQFTHQNDRAREALSKAISLGAAGGAIYAQLGYLHLQLQEFNGAISAYQQALMLEPKKREYKLALMHAFSASGQYAPARYLVDTLLRKNPDEPQLWLQRAVVAMEMQDTHTALASAEVAIRLGDKSVASRQLASQLHLKNGGYARAVALSRELYGEGQLKFKEMDKLIGYLRQMEQWTYISSLLSDMKKHYKRYSDAQLSRYYLYQGYWAQHKGNHKALKSNLEQAVEKDVTNGAALILLAKSILLSGNATHAELLYQRAEKLEGVRLQAMLSRTQLYIDQKEYGTALALLQQTHRLYPHQSNMVGNIRSLKNLVNNTQSDR